MNIRLSGSVGVCCPPIECDECCRVFCCDLIRPVRVHAAETLTDRKWSSRYNCQRTPRTRYLPKEDECLIAQFSGDGLLERYWIRGSIRSDEKLRDEFRGGAAIQHDRIRLMWLGIGGDLRQTKTDEGAHAFRERSTG